VSVQDSYLCTIYDVIYALACAGGPCAGGLFWQVMGKGMHGWSNGYEVISSQSPSTACVIAQQLRCIAGLNLAGAKKYWYRGPWKSDSAWSQSHTCTTQYKSQ
jgi:hypothetical protein